MLFRSTMAYPLRAVLRRVDSDLSLRITTALTRICDPVRKRSCRVRWIDRIVSRFFPSSCYYNTFPQLDPRIIREWNELDTHDILTDYYKHFRTPAEIHRCLSQLGFQVIRCDLAGNGVEARAVCP